MKEFSQHIQLVPVRQEVTDTFHVMSDRPFRIEFQCQSDDNGTFWNCEKSVTVDMPDTATLRFFRTERSCRVIVTDSGGHQYAIGNNDIPVRAVISPMLQTAQLQIRGELPWNPLL